jgi:hypothetical protein
VVSLADYLMGRDRAAPLSPEFLSNAHTIVDRVNELLKRFGEHRKVTSGYRPQAINQNVKNAAPHSNHMTCKACDLADPKNDLDEWCLKNLKALEEIGLWLEEPTSTPGWCHLQSVAPKSGRRVFIP